MDNPTGPTETPRFANDDVLGSDCFNANPRNVGSASKGAYSK